MPLFRKKSDAKQPSPLLTRAALNAKVQRTPSNRSAKKSPDPVNGDIGIGNSFFGAGSVRKGNLSDESDPGDLGISSQDTDEPLQTASRLSKTLQEIIHDRDALPHFIRFMEAQKAGQLIRFWLDAESFQASTWSRIRSHSLNKISKSSLTHKPSESQAKPDNSCIPQGFNFIQTKEAAPTLDGAECNVQKSSQIVGTESKTHASHDAGAHSHSGNTLQSVQYSEQLETLGAKSASDSRAIDKCKSKKIDDSESIVPGFGQLFFPTETQANTQTNPKQDSSCVIAKQTPTPNSSNETVGGLADKLKRSIEQDAVMIFTKYLAQDASDPVNVTDDIRNEAIHKICREDGEVDPCCFVSCQKFVLEQMQKRYYERFQSSEHHYRHQMEILTSGRVFLADILYNETAFFYFMEYMEQEQASYLLQFFMAAENFQQHLLAQGSGYDGMQAQADAMVLYDKYFSLQASQPLGFPDSVRFEVESNICQESGPLPDCFSKPRDIVLREIEKTYFTRYLHSEIFYKYLSELVSSVQTAQDFPLQQCRKRAGSGSSSDHSMGSHSTGAESVSSRNTLLAFSSNTLRNTVINKLDDEFSIDPDALWKRSQPGLMSVGKVDSLGQFMSQFDPGPDLDKKKSSGKGFFKKGKNKEKEEEEMARKVAEMIIKDVTSVTQAIGSMKKDQNDSAKL
ncbi:hypothetical protein CHS0354_006793 [Potamilus streckersoni]|uniref:RGS domain-containing protein n=1 Tax=Potamilus streckersoni TaxID=2493646 RepID=A0AAE0S863_9BIVA|nr:hypothetical protein CHS0354_006793 [Potamilus streckersoni]